MKYFKLIITLLIVLFLTLGVSSASEVNNAELTDLEPSELQILIDNAPENSIVNLDKDYYGGNITISKTLTINGNKHVLDGQDKLKILTVTAPNVVLNDIIFINGNSEYGGGALTMTNGEIINCTFKNNHAYSGGSIAVKSCKVMDSTFESNYATYGGAIICSDSELSNLILKDNVADMDGGAIEATNTTLSDLTCINNHAESGGGAISLYDSIINGSYFEKNTAGNYGGAIFKFFSDVNDCVFKGNSALLGGAIYQDSLYDDNSGPIEEVRDSIFISNHATEHGGAIFKVNTHVSGCKFENNYAGAGCDDICDNYNHTDDKTPSDGKDNYNRTDENASDDEKTNTTDINQSSKKDSSTFKIIESENRAGNPLGLLLLALIIPISRIRKHD